MWVATDHGGKLTRILLSKAEQDASLATEHPPERRTSGIRGSARPGSSL
jgi:hypothetical protein